VKSHEYAEELLGTHLAGRQWAEDYIYYFTIKPINWDDYDTYVPDGF
jgi:hypothetical protein